MWDWLTSWFRSTDRSIEIPAGTGPLRPLPAVADPSYAVLYRTQPAVRVCVDFLARNLAQLQLHLYRRLPNDSRERVRDHPIARLFEAPNPSTTRFSMIEQLVVDLGVFGNAFWYLTDTTPPQLVALPAAQVAVAGLMRPLGYAVMPESGKPAAIDPARVIHVKYANPECPAVGLSPLASLKARLMEEAAMDQYRLYFWRNYARLGGVIERGKDSGHHTPQQVAEFTGQWSEAFSGLHNQGKTPVLPQDWHFKELSSSAREAQLVEAKKATREEVAALYMIPLSMVGLMDKANYSNMQEQHRQLYTDCLPPLTRRIESELMRSLFPHFSGTDGLYVEFNIFEKLLGAFEEQAASLRSSVGQPYMSVNEARIRLNLPRLLDPQYDAPVIPLNVIAGAGQVGDVNAEVNPDPAAVAVRSRPEWRVQ